MSAPQFKAFPDKWDWDSVLGENICKCICRKYLTMFTSQSMSSFTTASSLSCSFCPSLVSMISGSTRGAKLFSPSVAPPTGTRRKWLMSNNRLDVHFKMDATLFLHSVQVRDYQTCGGGRGMCTARPGWQTISPQNMSYKSRMFPVKINLVDILEIDTDRRTVRCEPLVSMGQLTATLDNLGWTIPIGIIFTLNNSSYDIYLILFHFLM